MSRDLHEVAFTFEELDDLLKVLKEKDLLAEEHAFATFLMPDQIGAYQTVLRSRGYSNFQMILWNKDIIPPYAQQNRFASTTTYMLLAFSRKESKTAGGRSHWHFEVNEEGEDEVLQVSHRNLQTHMFIMHSTEILAGLTQPLLPTAHVLLQVRHSLYRCPDQNKWPHPQSFSEACGVHEVACSPFFQAGRQGSELV